MWGSHKNKYKRLNTIQNNEHSTSNNLNYSFKLLYSGQLSYLGGSEGSVADSEDAIRPLMRDGVKLTIQLAHGDGFGIDHCDLYLVLIHQTLV